jgi:nitrate reductase gamma subunit
VLSHLDYFFFTFYPYICVAAFVIGCWSRFERDQYSWQAASSQMLSKSKFRLASNLFHLGMLGLFGGHVMGLVVPGWINEVAGVTGAMHQHMELIVGGSMGLAAIVGLSLLLYRRVVDPRIRRTGNGSDLVIAGLLWVTLIAGMATLPHSFATRSTGVYMHHLNDWAQHVLMFRAGAAETLSSVPFAFKLHMIIAMTVFVVLPYTRLVHALSVPVGYLFRRHYQIVRS